MRNREALDAAVEEVQSKEDAVVASLSERVDYTDKIDSGESPEPDLGSLVIDQGVDE